MLNWLRSQLATFRIKRWHRKAMGRGQRLDYRAEAEHRLSRFPVTKVTGRIVTSARVHEAEFGEAR